MTAPWVTGACCAMTALALAGCSSSFADKPVDEIAKAVANDMNDVTALTMDGSVDVPQGKTSLMVSMDDEGDCVGTLEQDGGKAEYIVVGGDETFIKGDAAFYENTGAIEPAVIEQVADQWVKQDIDTGFCDLDQFLDVFDENDEDEDDDDFKKGEEAEVAGKDTVELSGEKDGAKARIWVATDGDHYVLKMESKGGDQPGTFTFSDYNKDVKAEEPDGVIEQPSA